MANPLFRRRAITLVESAQGKYVEAAQVDHLGLQGRFREIALEQLIRPFLPIGFDVGTGKIADSNGVESPEVDLVIYAGAVLPPVMYSDRDGIFPVEACLYAIEVKSKITATEFDETIKKAVALRGLRYAPGQHDPKDSPINHRVDPVIPVLFAFSSDLTDSGKTEIERYKERDPQSTTTPAISAMCVLGRGYWWFNKNREWQFHSPTDDHDEVIDFVSGIVNTLHGALESRGNPRLGEYLMIR